MTRSGILRTAVLVLLAMSLAGNFFTIGYLVHRWQSGLSSLSTTLEARYPPDVRRAFREVLRENRPAMRSAFAELRAARDAQEALARQHPVDEAAIRAAMAEVRTKTAELQSILQDYLMTAIKSAEAVSKDR
ncbi:periplasmic heavy metal sensor [Rhizobium ruizarguesonis]|uniref:periplasmic heavy metal sensor n=1 Tax=Rhizobium ruizarguesonis TaxID=2081791 RepID=UPI0010319AC5|nr:periplasmic heavy metal sensor [Rhizobium ruizarguesonis]TAY75079.1 periplasmic heavy metal sensor [Rhizobium ruizarguesonis]